jgi:hypothetical protein
MSLLSVKNEMKKKGYSFLPYLEKKMERIMFLTDRRDMSRAECSIYIYSSGHICP